MTRYRPLHGSPTPEAGRRGGHGLRRVGAVGLVVLALAVALLVATVVWGSSGGHHSVSKRAIDAGRPRAARSGNRATRPSTSPPATASPKPATFSGPNGVEARWVVAENQKPGTTAWQITTAVGATISGYADHTAAVMGDTVKLFVSTAAPTFTVAAYRIGWYGGTGARLVWTSPSLAGAQQATCPATGGTNTVTCPWSPSVSVPISAAWPPGTYLLELVAQGGQQSYIPLTVWDPASHSAYVVLGSVLTWQAWNSYGGYNAFGGAPPGQTPQFADRSSVLSFDRPYARGNGASDYLGLEMPVIRFMEENGLDVTYVTDTVLSENPALLTAHKALISQGHNEFITGAERQGEVAALAAGVNIAFLGATPDLRPARLQPSLLGADREEVAYRDAAKDPVYATDPQVSTANTWADPPLDHPASEVVGDAYGGYGINSPLVVTDPQAWPFAGTGLGQGAQLPHVVRGDYDHYVPGESSPADVQVLAHSPVVASYGTPGNADMTYYTKPGSNAGVFATGTIGWIPSMGACPPPATTASTCPGLALDDITANVLRLFGNGPAGLSEPSQTNWQQFSG